MIHQHVQTQQQQLPVTETSSSLPFLHVPFGPCTILPTQNNSSYVTLDAVPYAASGPFAINLWVKMASTDMNGSLFEYVFSHTAAAGFTAMGPDQVCVGFERPALSLIRCLDL